MNYCWVNVEGIRKLHVCVEYDEGYEVFPICGTRVDVRYLEHEPTIPSWAGPEDICKKCTRIAPREVNDG